MSTNLEIIEPCSKNTIQRFWYKPKSKSIGFYSDSRIYLDVLEYGQKVDYFTKNDLKRLLSNRVKGLVYTENISKTAVDTLMYELVEFGWIGHFLKENRHEINNPNFSKNKNLLFTDTNKGLKLLEKYFTNHTFFWDNLIVELANIYVIPGWFIQRLWDINPDGQGEIIIPIPPRTWSPYKRKWNDNEWTVELDQLVTKSYEDIVSKYGKCFPIKQQIWIDEIKKRWYSQSQKKPRSKKNINSTNHEFTPRKRLTLAMKEAAVKLLFSNFNPNTKCNDFVDWENPLLPRTYSYWCSKLEEIGLINYTDYNPFIAGRLIYPIASFREQSEKGFREIKDIVNFNNTSLKIFRPDWNDIYKLFIETLFEEYNKIYRRKKSLYISIQDLRDEVCRVLKLSSFLFNTFLEKAIGEQNYGDPKLRIALETDIREDQRSRTQMQRKSVYVNNNIISLISITKY